MSERTLALSVQSLTTAVGRGASQQTILEDVSFSLREGEVLGIVGESGSGKSMLALTLMGLLPQSIARTSGTVELFGTELTSLSKSAWRSKRGREMAMIFQEPMTSLNPIMRISEQITEVLIHRRGLSGEAAEAEALRLLDRVKIPDPAVRLRAYPFELSGGMRQRVMIAMALAANSRVLIADEPTTALDVTIQAQVLDLLRELKAETGMALLLITHDLGVIAEMAERVMVMYAGKMAELASVRDIFYRPRHPYTKALLNSIPTLDGNQGRLATIRGSVPAVGAFPQGCRFAPRCDLAQPVCTERFPEPLNVADDHLVACYEPFGFDTKSIVKKETNT